MYKNVQTPHSPLSPLPPRIQLSEYITEKAQNFQYLTPSYQAEKMVARRNTRRSFTPSAFDNAAPPSVSPIQTVFESPDSDSENSAILQKSVSSATKLAELMNASENSPFAELQGVVDRKSQSATDHKKRRYHGQRKFENRPTNVNINLTSLRRSLFEQSASPSMPENRKIGTPGSGTPCAVFNPMNITVKRGSRPKPLLPSSPLINKYTPLKDTFHAPEVNEPNTSRLNLGDDSILNTNFRIESVLKEIGLGKYIEKFQVEEIDLFVFFNLEPADLFELKIAEEDHETMLQAIKTYAF